MSASHIDEDSLGDCLAKCLDSGVGHGEPDIAQLQRSKAWHGCLQAQAQSGPGRDTCVVQLGIDLHGGGNRVHRLTTMSTRIVNLGK